MRYKDLLNERRLYTGSPLETGGTSINHNAAPALRNLAKNFHGKILDYGAGRYARNANYLRDLGMEVYAYDPFNGSPDGDGWNETTTNLPSGVQFDVAFTSFVLNVVPDHIEETILADIKTHSDEIYHITRNMDIFDTVKRAMLRGDDLVNNFFKEYFASPEEIAALENGTLSDETIKEFCRHGVQTSKGFQRIPMLEEKGYTQLTNRSGFKVYTI